MLMQFESFPRFALNLSFREWELLAEFYYSSSSKYIKVIHDLKLEVKEERGKNDRDAYVVENAVKWFVAGFAQHAEVSKSKP